MIIKGLSKSLLKLGTKKAEGEKMNKAGKLLTEKLAVAHQITIIQKDWELDSQNVKKFWARYAQSDLGEQRNVQFVVSGV